MKIMMTGIYPADSNTISSGVQAVVLYLTRALQNFSDLKLDIVTLGKRGSERRTVRHGKISVHYLPSVRWRSHLSYIGNVRLLAAEMKRLKPDLIHAQGSDEHAEAAARSGLPWVLTLHGVRFLEVDLWRGFMNKVYRGWFVKRTERRVVRSAQHIISCSPFIQSMFGAQIRGHVYDIENPIGEAFFNVPQKSIAHKLLFVGRLIPRKGVHTLLRSFAQLHRRMPEAQLRLAGGEVFSNESISYSQGLKQFVKDKGLDKAVTFLGELDKADLLKEYSNCSALVLPSVLETTSLALMEAMAAGKAIVSTDAGGARYLIEQKRTGLIVPSNDETALAEALYQILSDQTRLEEMGRRAREIARKRFHASAVAARTRDVYYKILGQLPPTEATVD